MLRSDRDGLFDSEMQIPSARAQYCFATQIAGWGL